MAGRFAFIRILASAVALASAAACESWRAIERFIEFGFAFLAEPMRRPGLTAPRDRTSSPALAFAGNAPPVERHEAGTSRRAAARGI